MYSPQLKQMFLKPCMYSAFSQLWSGCFWKDGSCAVSERVTWWCLRLLCVCWVFLFLFFFLNLPRSRLNTELSFQLATVFCASVYSLLNSNQCFA